MRIKLERSFYIPTGATKIAHKGSSAVAYIYERAGILFAVAFHGKAAKSDWHHRFKDAAARAKRIGQHFDNVAASEGAAVARRSARNQAHKLEAGMILVSSWGYDQTNVDFFEIIEVPSSHFVVVEKIGGMRATDSGEYGHGMAQEVVPDPSSRTGKIYRRKVDTAGSASIAISSSQHASAWNGRPMYCSWYA